VAELRGRAGLGRLRRHLEHRAVGIHLPAVIEAAQPAFLVPTVDQARLSVRAELADQADAALGVAVGDQLLAENAHPDRLALRLLDLLGQADGQPVGAHQPAHRGVARDAAEDLVLGLGEHRAGPPATVLPGNA
jgi:hypothetical protein